MLTSSIFLYSLFLYGPLGKGQGAGKVGWTESWSGALWTKQRAEHGEGAKKRPRSELKGL